MRILRFIVHAVGLFSSLSLFFLGIAIIFYSSIDGYHIILKIFTSLGSKEEIIIGAMKVLDLSLLGFSVFITAVGIFVLFVKEIDGLPAWLELKDFDSLKAIIVKVIIVVMGVSFMGKAVTWEGEYDLLNYGLANAAVILALSAFFLAKKTH